MLKLTNSVPLAIKCFLAVVLGLLLAPQGIRMIHQHRVKAEAQRWHVKATEAAVATWTEEDAVSWLKDHGFTEVMKGEGTSYGPNLSQRYFVVRGYFELDEGGLFTDPATVIVTFIFGLDHKLERVEYHLWPFRAP